MRTRGFLFLLVILLLFQAGSAQAAGLPAPLLYTGCTRTDTEPAQRQFEENVVYLTNLERRTAGLPPLKDNPLLTLAARYHAVDMVQDDYFAHDSYDGQNLVCSWDKRVVLWYDPWHWLGENIAAGHTSPAQVVQAWMDSPLHKDNILETGFREIGIGFFQNYWVQDFGSTYDVYPVVIEWEAPRTQQAQVTLWLHGGPELFSSVRIRNDGGEWSEWLPFANEIPWTLRSEAGLRTVTVEYAAPNGAILARQSSDTIILDYPQLAIDPAEVTFIFLLNQGAWLDGTERTLTPFNASTTDPLTWSATETSDLLTLTSLAGTTPSDSTVLSLQGVDTSLPGLYIETVTFSAEAPAGTLNSPATVTVSILVVEDLADFLFLPVVIH